MGAGGMVSDFFTSPDIGTKSIRIYIIIIIIISNLSNDRSKAPSKTIPPHSAI